IFSMALIRHCPSRATLEPKTPESNKSVNTYRTQIQSNNIECRKTCGSGAKRTKIVRMGYSTLRLDLWRETQSVEETPGYCWSTSQCRKLCFKCASAEGLKISGIQRSNSSHVAWKEDDQQYPGVKLALPSRLH